MTMDKINKIIKTAKTNEDNVYEVFCCNCGTITDYKEMPENCSIKTCESPYNILIFRIFREDEVRKKLEMLRDKIFNNFKKSFQSVDTAFARGLLLSKLEEIKLKYFSGKK